MPLPLPLPSPAPPPPDYWRGLIRWLQHGHTASLGPKPASSAPWWRRRPSPQALLRFGVDAALCAVFLTGAWGAAASFEGLASDLACRDVGRSVLWCFVWCGGWNDGLAAARS